MPDERIAIRFATHDDAATIAEHRVRLFQDTGRLDAERAAAMLEQVSRPGYRAYRAARV